MTMCQFTGTVKPHVLRENKDCLIVRQDSLQPPHFQSLAIGSPPPPPPHRPLSMSKSGYAVFCYWTEYFNFIFGF